MCPFSGLSSHCPLRFVRTLAWSSIRLPASYSTYDTWRIETRQDVERTRRRIQRVSELKHPSTCNHGRIRPQDARVQDASSKTLNANKNVSPPYPERASAAALFHKARVSRIRQRKSTLLQNIIHRSSVIRFLPFPFSPFCRFPFSKCCHPPAGW